MTPHTLVLFSRSGMGDAPAELQLKLAGIFLSLLNQDDAPGAIAFYGDGVKLACEGSPVIDQLQSLASKGVVLILCQTCLDFYGIRSLVRVGVIGGMGDIMDAMNQADKVISV